MRQFSLLYSIFKLPVMLLCLAFVSTERPLLAQTGFPLQGTVTNSVTGEAIRHASVQALGPRPRAALTDDEGHFRLEGLPEGEVPVIVAKPGFLPEQSANPAEQGPTVARIGLDAPALSLKLVPQSVIFGRVTSAGDALENIPIAVARVLVANGRKVFTDQGAALTNDNGEFRVANLPAGAYYVSAGPSSRLFPGASGVANPREAVYPQTFYPNVPSMEAATVVTVQPGLETETSIELKSEPVFRVSGFATGFPPGDLGTLQFARSARDGTEAPAQFDAQSGKFEIKLRAGSYRIRGSGGQGIWGTVGDAPLVVNADATGIRLPLVRLSAIPVTARLESSRNAGNSSSGLRGVRVEITLTSRHNFTAQADYETNVTAGRAETLADVEPESYSVTLVPAEGWWVQSAQSGGVDLLASDLTVAAGAHPSAIEVVLRDDVANLTGTVSNPAKAATVLLLPPADSRREIKTATVSTEGTFEFTGVAPGTYSVLALDRTSGVEYTKREVLEPYLSKAAEVTLAPGGSGTAQLEFARVEP